MARDEDELDDNLTVGSTDIIKESRKKDDDIEEK